MIITVRIRYSYYALNVSMQQNLVKVEESVAIASQLEEDRKYLNPLPLKNYTRIYK